ncbi:unnamed protein product [Mytilus edulis]|uniref:Uncharacterized protein n=1 Tax=Mytilus edulis TaxID=6550 RepID=A0A8S3UI31_MYTED|nr:unnamed protein product [Mytilus edulis]
MPNARSKNVIQPTHIFSRLNTCFHNKEKGQEVHIVSLEKSNYMGRHSLNSKLKYKRKKREQNRQKKKESVNISDLGRRTREQGCIPNSPRSIGGTKNN